MQTKKCKKCDRILTIDNFHRDKHKEDGFRNDCKECRNKYHDEYYQNNKELFAERNKKFYQNNKKICLDLSRKYKKLNFEKEKERLKHYRKNHLEERRINNQKYRARKQGLISNLTTEQWNKVKQHFHNECAYCGEKSHLEQDHFVSVSKGGEYTSNNIIPACRKCNGSKQNKNFFDWYPKSEYYSNKREKMILDFLGYNKDKRQQLSLYL